MGVVSLLASLLAMDLVLHAEAYRLGVKRTDIKLPWEREPVNPVFAKKQKLIKPPVYVPEVDQQSEQVSIPIAAAEGHIKW